MIFLLRPFLSSHLLKTYIIPPHKYYLFHKYRLVKMPLTTHQTEKYLILYASQTGNAESIARNIHQEAVKRGFSGECYVMNEYDKIDLEKIEVLICVTSNTGDGDPPENATKFFRFLRKIKTKTFFGNARFAILGLGDTNYSNFNNTARRLEKKLLELGGSSFYEKGLADDATGLEAVVDPWIENLWPALTRVCIQKEPMTSVAVDFNLGSIALIPKVQNGENFTFNGNLVALTNDQAIKTLASTEEDARSMNSSFDYRYKVKGSKIVIDISELEQATQLTALPRIPNELCKIEDENSTKGLITPLWPNFFDTPTRMFGTKISAVRCLTHPNADKRTLHIELDIKEHRDEFHFVPGDAIGIWAPYNETLVWEILRTLEIDEIKAHKEISIVAIEGAGILKMKIFDCDFRHLTLFHTYLPSHLKNVKSTSIFELLRYRFDITTYPRKAMLRLLAEYAKDVEEQKLLLFLSSKQGAKQFNSLREQQPTLLDILVTFPSCKPPIQRLFDVLPPHQPRYYSIANSPMLNTNSLHIAFNVVQYNTPNPFNIPRWGVCTPWLDELAGLITTRNKRTIVSSNREIPIFLKPNVQGFTVPQDTKRPLIMIGPGTGIAPFIGFLQHYEQHRAIRRRMTTIGIHARREVDKQFGDLWLFYGCRDKDKDFLYQDELQGFLERGVLKKLEVAISRELGAGENGKPKYVQDLIRSRGNELYELIDKKDALIFVCGDAKGMAKDVNDALIDILCEHGGIERGDASKLLITWIEEKRYLRDLWG
ncbi:hypothetical protein G9A89_019362 [Geosiphon pyriformis]|nr:hypothetical protein G9A89_019362 [Geosiphon pyriformis]